jgi:hypothetical protein
MSAIADHVKAHKALRVVSTDADGNIQANVRLRTGTLASLLAISNAGDGEIAIATDKNAYVIYKGDPSVGRAYFKNGFRSLAAGGTQFQTLPVGTTLTQLNLDTAQQDSDGLVDASADIINIPAPLTAGNKTLVSLSITGANPIPFAAGTAFNFVLQTRQIASPSAWFAVINNSVTVSDTTANNIMWLSGEAIINPAEYNQLRIMAKHDSGAAIMGVTAYVMKFTEV